MIVWFGVVNHVRDRLIKADVRHLRYIISNGVDRVGIQAVLSRQNFYIIKKRKINNALPLKELGRHISVDKETKRP